MRTLEKGIVYDATAVSRILGLPVECSDPAPEAADGEVVVWYGGLDLKQLRTCPAGKRLMWQKQGWYDKYGWKGAPGYYRLRLPIPDSSRMTYTEQQKFLLPGEEVAPVCVTATALLVHLAAIGIDLLMNDWCRWSDLVSDVCRAGLDVSVGRVHVDDCWDDRSDAVWLVGSRMC